MTDARAAVIGSNCAGLTVPDHLCSPPEGTAGGPYPGIAHERRPLLFVSGERDELCQPAALYRFAARAPGPLRVAVVDGGHDLRGEAGAELAGRLVADFLASHCAGPC